MLRALLNPIRYWLEALKLEVQVNRVLLRFSGLKIQRPSIWQYDTLAALDIGKDVWVGPFTEIVAFSKSPRSRVAGKLILRDRAIVTAGCNIRAAGGVIEIGPNSGIGQGSAVVAAGHHVSLDKLYMYCDWVEEKTGVTIGSNCWIGAGCVLLPGVSIGDNAVVGAGSVVSRDVPANEIWAGIPARFIRTIT